MIEYSKQIESTRISSDELHRELKNRSVNIRDARIIVNCYSHMYIDPKHADGIFRLKSKGKPTMNVFISTPDVNSLVSVYSPGAYYQLYIEEYDIFIVYKRFGSFHPDVLKASVTKRVRNILSEGINVKRKKVKKNDN